MKELKLTSCSMLFFKPRSMPLDILLIFFSIRPSTSITIATSQEKAKFLIPENMKRGKKIKSTKEKNFSFAKSFLFKSRSSLQKRNLFGECFEHFGKFSMPESEGHEM